MKRKGLVHGWFSRVHEAYRHVHDFDEYLLVVQGQYTVLTDSCRTLLSVGDEFLIPRSTPHSGESAAGTRVINAFGARRARREAG